MKSFSALVSFVTLNQHCNIILIAYIFNSFCIKIHIILWSFQISGEGIPLSTRYTSVQPSKNILTLKQQKQKRAGMCHDSNYFLFQYNQSNKHVKTQLGDRKISYVMAMLMQMTPNCTKYIYSIHTIRDGMTKFFSQKKRSAVKKYFLTNFSCSGTSTLEYQSFPKANNTSNNHCKII